MLNETELDPAFVENYEQWLEDEVFSEMSESDLDPLDDLPDSTQPAAVSL